MSCRKIRKGSPQRNVPNESVVSFFWQFSTNMSSYLENGASDPLHVWFYARVFGKGGSNGAISDSIKSKVAADGHLGYTKMAITSQLVCQSTCYLVLGWGFSGTAELMVQLSNFKNPRWQYKRTAVVHNPCVSWAFLFISLVCCFIIMAVYR